MLSEAVNSAKEYVTKNKKTAVIVLLLGIGILLLMLSSRPVSQSEAAEESENLNEYKFHHC